MKTLSDFKNSIQYVLTDIDDTLTDEGQLGAKAYSSLWELKKAGIKVIPITGRPAGWCEMIARLWPVDAVVGENGAFYFKYFQQQMHREFAVEESLRMENQKKLIDLKNKILTEVPGCAVASDQFCRLFDLAIDFCEDVNPLPKSSLDHIVKLFTDVGAQAKVSSIHVNGWFGQYDKLSMTKILLKKEFGITEEQIKTQCGFCGDSPNDEPMFSYFPHSFGVANVENFKAQMTHLPTYVAPSRGGEGFAEIANKILSEK